MNDRSKPDSLVSTLISAGRFGLMILGLIGISVEIFRDDGWLKQLLGKAFASPGTLLLIPIGIGILYFIDKAISTNTGKPSSKGDIPLYFMMAVGAFFLFRLVTTGSF